MRLTWDEAKRIATFTHRGLDFADAAKGSRATISQRPTIGATTAS